MSSYLAAYGEGQAERAGTILRLIGGFFLAVIVATVLYFQFRDYSLNHVASEFVNTLRKGNHAKAYELWGCTSSTPCLHYPYQQFLKDWGPVSSYRDASKAKFVGTKSCTDGVLKFVRFPAQPDVVLWINRKDKSVGFAPWTLKTFPEGFKHKVQEWMWEVTQNCQPLIEP
ncbi:MAG: hypothetical protein WKF37_07590 [Bryobacteraceae bacterium]